MTAVPALEIGGTHAAAALVDDGQPLSDARVRRGPVRSHGTAEQIVDDLVAVAAGLDAARGARWGVALPGPFDLDAGVGWFAGVGKFDALYGYPLGAVLARRLDAELVFINDAHAFGLGEWCAGTVHGHDRAVLLTLGTGVGSCFLDRGEPVVTGPEVPPQGRADLLAVNGRALEDVVSRRALLAAAGSVPGVDVEELAARARAGDDDVAAVFDDAMLALGKAMAPWVRRFAASVVVVGGGIAASWDLVAPPLRAGLNGGGAESEVVAASSTHAGLVGAAHRAR